MKKQSLFARILIPTLVILAVLPPVACLIFRRAAEQYAYAEAEKDLRALQESVLPLMEQRFEDNRTSGMQERVHGFLKSVSGTVRRQQGRAKLLIYAPGQRLIYPNDEQERSDAQAVSALCAAYMQSERFDEGTGVVRLSGDGENDLVSVYRVPAQSQQIEYLVTYCPVSQIGTWIDGASRMVLLIAFGMMALVALVLWFAAGSVAKPLCRLCKSAAAIGAGSFDEITPSFSVREPESLRQSMNAMVIQLRRADEVQRDFFQNVSHELRNPLMSICGYAQGIEQGVFPEPKQAAHTILEESDRLTRLVSSLLTLSRIESGQHTPTLAPLCVGACIEDNLDRAAGAALQKGIRLTYAAPDRWLYALGDEELFAQVAENLLSNAVRYAHETVEVSCAEKDGRIQVTVADDGDGLDEKDLPRIFERCYKGKGGHFGIGLAIARSAAEQMHGTISAENRKGGGACFTWSLQKADEPQELTDKADKR